MDLKAVDVRLAVCDHPIGRLPWKIRCRQASHKDDEMSMAVYPDGIKCYGCGFVCSRRMEALAYLLYGDTKRWLDAIGVAERYTRHEEDRGREVRRDPLLNVYAEILFANLITHRKHRLAWLYERGLRAETIADFRLGHDGARFTIPVYDACGRLLTIRYRRDDWYMMEEDTTPKYCGMAGRNDSYLYPLWKLDGTEWNAIAIVEGELDAVLCWQLGIGAITMTNGAGSMPKIPAMLKELYPYWNGTLIIIGDMDDPGRAASVETEKAAHAQGYSTESILWHPDDGKDVTEYIQKNKKERLLQLWKKKSSS